MREEVFDTCTWCNKKGTIITCACCKEPVKYGDSLASDKLKINGKGLMKGASNVKKYLY